MASCDIMAPDFVTTEPQNFYRLAMGWEFAANSPDLHMSWLVGMMNFPMEKYHVPSSKAPMRSANQQL